MTQFIYQITAGDVAITSVILAITILLWVGGLSYLLFVRRDQ